MFDPGLWDYRIGFGLNNLLRTYKMCNNMTPEQKFMRRKVAAINFIWTLLNEGLSDEDAVQATTDKFNLNPSIRDDYRIYKELWGMASGI